LACLKCCILSIMKVPSLLLSSFSLPKSLCEISLYTFIVDDKSCGSYMHKIVNLVCMKLWVLFRFSMYVLVSFSTNSPLHISFTILFTYLFIFFLSLVNNINRYPIFGYVNAGNPCPPHFNFHYFLINKRLSYFPKTHIHLFYFLFFFVFVCLGFYILQSTLFYLLVL